MTRRFLAAGLLLGGFLAALALVLAVGLAPARASSAGSPTVPRWGRDIQVNPSVVRTPASQRNAALAINPLDQNNVIAS
jgi:hypothetical protein